MICSSPEEFASAIAEHGVRVEAGTARRDPVVFRAIDETFLETHEPVNMRWAVFEGVEFNNVLLGPWATFRDARFVNCTFHDCMIYGVFFRAGILEGCRIEKTTLIGCSFLNSRFIDTSIEETQFVHDDLRMMKWKGCQVRRVRMMLLSARQAEWSNCELTNCDVFDALFDEATISGCRFVGGSMCRVSTRGTHFERSSFDGVKVLDTSFDESCVPDDSTSSGMLMRRTRIAFAPYRRCADEWCRDASYDDPLHSRHGLMPYYYRSGIESIEPRVEISLVRSEQHRRHLERLQRECFQQHGWEAEVPDDDECKRYALTYINRPAVFTQRLRVLRRIRRGSEVGGGGVEHASC